MMPQHRPFSLGAVAVFFVVQAIVVAAPAEADTYYACGSAIGGRPIELQVKDGAVRCYAAASYRYYDVGNCFPGQNYDIDYTGNADKCVTGIGTAAVVADPPCGAGQSLDRRPGKDRCRKLLSEYIRAPDNEVNR
jgi:hypothetical protein